MTPMRDMAADRAPLSTCIIGSEEPERSRAESELADADIILPMSQQPDWFRAHGLDSRLVVVRDHEARPLCAAGIGVAGSRALPGSRIHRIERFCGSSNTRADQALISAIANGARSDRRCLRLVIELFERDQAVRRRLCDALGASGFVCAPQRRLYDRTLCLALGPSESELLAAIHATARRHIRAPAKRGLELRAVVDQALASRLDSMMREVYSRTAGEPPTIPWGDIIRLSVERPERSRIVGLFDPKAPGADSLVAYAWGCVHSGYASYEAGASTRREDLGNVPMNYAPLWDLVLWARTSGAEWFDLGGITGDTSSGDRDPLGGISAFKRYFSHDVVEVGEDWVLEPHWVQASVARLVSGAYRSFQRLG